MADDPVNGAAFVSTHGHVLVAVAEDPRLRLRDLAERLGLTERTVLTAVGDLKEGGFLTRRRVGRRNEYVVHPEAGLVDPHLSHHTAAEFLTAMAHPSEEPSGPTVPTVRIELAVTDPRRSAELYARVGFDAPQHALPDGTVVVAARGIELALRSAEDPSQPTPSPRLGLPCATRRQAVELIASLVDAGLEATDRREHDEAVSATFVDPDGHLIHVSWDE